MMKRTLLFLFGIMLTGSVLAAAGVPPATEAVCANEAECPSGVALILAKKPDGELDRCSSFLIDSRTLVTNRHCIPEDLQDKTLSCVGRIAAVFPQTAGYAAERAECESILNISEAAQEFPTGHMDYAVIRLNRPVKRAAFPISREGLPNRIKVTTYSFDPVHGSPVNAVLRKKSCESIQNTDLIPGYIDALSPVASFTGCQIIRGNSGSVAVDEKGRVRAIVHATWPMDKKYAPLSVMTNMACVDLPTGFPVKDSRCDEKRPSEFNFKAFYANALEMNFDSQFQAFQLSNRAQFRFSKSRVFANDRMVVIPQIQCLEKSALKALAEAGTTEAMLALSLPIWGPEKFITADYRYDVVPSQFASAYTTVQFDVAQMLTQGRALAHEVRGSYFIYSDREYELAVCGN
ncbi:trypsin-like serine peptidase [Bdellovibrio sp. HCB2-146]|uniref:trypsin-like serine peptidase n=1 Tax=Bdellovibrio sp. HCB2-146 TaxID=3394362 RepID=UPI0039BD4251